MSAHLPGRARPIAAVLDCALAGTVLLSGCGPGTSGEAAADPVRTSLERLVAAIPDDAQVSVVGSDGDVITAGEVSESTAWSTIKVPIVIEALREGGDELDEQAREAITESDNDAASTLFATLGGGYQSSTRVDNLLREAGDETTLTLPNAALGGDTGFGMTQWSSADQARFASWLACSDDEAADHVYTLMSDLVDAQAVGIETVAGGHAKSGWGTNESTGVSTMRQLGVIDTGSGFIAMSIIITGDDYQDVIGEITVLSDWLAGHEDELPTFRCGASGG
ncbi:hypothetical protein [uncultured Propionibacterium sp.]|uniref:hypothetical protein n=1 Tax=uncultured Propionibacterium sp. TaxID=218066 RepID=UPI002930C3FD|nr:hypothetical protein [uncultured Propionibacterium sp.]